MVAKQKQDIILYVGKILPYMITAIRSYEKQSKRKFRIALLFDIKEKRNVPTDDIIKNIDLVLSCNTLSESAIQETLLPYEDELLAISCRGEDYIEMFARIIPFVPYLRTPTSESLRWASDKLLMRRRLFTYNKKITPAYTVVTDTTKASLEKIEQKVGFPLVVKPTGLAASRLVTICFHKEELETSLKKVFKKINALYQETGGNWTPQVLVEQFMDGEMYSIDGYVSARGKVQFVPLVHIQTGRTIGFDDFFGYIQMTPTNLNKESIDIARGVAREAVHALALRSTAVHIELMKTEGGWKVIEIAARQGGYRHHMYDYSYGINHTMNDILIRIPEEVHIKRKTKGYTAYMKFFAKKEGRLTKLTGVKRAQELKSFKEISVNKKITDMCTYAKNGGTSVFNILLFNSEKSELLADIRRLEQMVEIEVQ
ncbi:MAG: ATP-grasp domain-containing protein [Candidatus Magasanikbacteria bacterium]|nr:ATP-grasp domain-containing protein [Candidatus Magasanikbacteria bacterium]